MKETTYRLKVTFLTPILGSQPQKSIASEFLAKRAGFDSLPEDELESLPDALDKGTTVFHRTPKGECALFDYQIKGFLKNSAQVQNGDNSAGLKAFKSKVNNLVFVRSLSGGRMIPLHVPDGEDMIFNERPLRAETMQGPRVALARSEQLPENTWFECGITILGDAIGEKLLRELLDYGFYMGLGQWRNGSWGQFRYELTKEE